LRFPGATYLFSNGQWNDNFRDIEVFDDAFVYNNVYSGPLVALEQRRSLHKIIIGSQGVTLAREIELLDEQIRNINLQVRYLSDQIRPHLVGALSVEQFCDLARIEGVEEQTNAKLIELDAKKNASAIRSTGVFSDIRLPSVDVGEVEQLFQSGVENLSVETERRLQDHFSHIGVNAEAWLADGVNRIADETCPFCTQSISDQAIIRDYRAHFSSSYNELKATIARKREEINRVFGGDGVAEFLQQVALQDTKRTFWNKFATLPGDPYPLEEIRTRSANLRNVLIARIEQKAGAPLDSIDLSEDDARFIAEYDAVRTAVQQITDALVAVNVQIQALKEHTSTVNLHEIEEEIALLRAIKSRYSEPAEHLCQDLLEVKGRKVAAEERKSHCREALNAHTASIFPVYQAAINEYLEDLVRSSELLV
jgi:wobble nucleotide-excising tRNase